MGTFNGQNMIEALGHKRDYEVTRLRPRLRLSPNGTALNVIGRAPEHLAELKDIYSVLSGDIETLASMCDPELARQFMCLWAGRMLALADAITEGAVVA